jgi:drug/metabolite transporter (DMT)-like permease
MIIKKPWLLYALITTVFWGTWGALIEIPEKAGFPATLGYIVWSLTMIPCALVALALIKWKLDHSWRAIMYGMIIGLLGAGGQLALFHALVSGPAYLVFPIISLSPTITIVFSVIFLKETASKRHWIGITMALAAILLMSIQKPDDSIIKGYIWFILAILVFVAWGTQAFFMKKANTLMKAESIFFYMMISGILLTPIAYLMTDMSQEINWGFMGPYFAAIIHTLNSIGALMLVYAIRYGKVIIVSPLTNAVAPIITVILSLIIYMVIPGPVIMAGMVIALVSVYLLAD